MSLTVNSWICSKYKPHFRYKIERIIGEGTYGQVYQVCDSANKRYALKKFKDLSNEPHETTISECYSLQALNHPNIIRPLDIAIENVSCLLLLDLMDGDLGKLIKKKLLQQKAQFAKKCIVKSEQIVQSKPVGLCRRIVKSIIRQLLEAMVYMQERHIFHRDIKPQNILYKIITKETDIATSYDDSDMDITVQFADLGLAKTFAPTVKAEADYGHHVQTMWYRSPEILLSAKTYQPAIDMWSIGCVMVECATGRPLFPGDCAFDQIRLIFQLLGTPSIKDWPGYNSTHLKHYNQLFPHWTCNHSLIHDMCHSLIGDDGINLLMRMLTYDPWKRITPVEALKHPWFLENQTLSKLTVQEEEKKQQSINLNQVNSNINNNDNCTKQHETRKNDVSLNDIIVYMEDI